MPTPECVATIKDAIVAIAAAATAGAALYGVSSWRRELQGRVEFTAAHELMLATYKLRDELRACRSPFVSGAEFPSSYASSFGKRSAREEAEAYAHVYQNRIAPVYSALRDFEAKALAAEALWGADIRAKTTGLSNCVADLRAGIGAIIDDKANGGADFASDRDFGKRMRETISAIPSDSVNPLSQKIADAIASIESTVRPHLKRRRA